MERRGGEKWGIPTIIDAPGSGDVSTNHPGLRREARKFLEKGYAIVRYDKRGSGASGGEIVGVSVANSLETIPLLADDLSTVIEEILKLPEVDTDRVGLYGVSQASWYMPLVMANEPELDFAVYQSAGAIPIGIHMIFEALSIHQGLPFDEATRQFEEIAKDYDGPLGFDQRPLLEASPHALSHGRKGPERPVPRESGRDPASCKSGRGCHVLSRRPARWRARASWKTSGRWPSGSRSDRAHSKGLYHPVLFLLPVNRFQA